VAKLGQTRHAHIVQIFDFGHILPNSGFLFVDMELCAVSLGRCIEELGESFRRPEGVCDVMKQITDGLVFIHGQGKAHRNLSPAKGE
jgi:serine/threonine protein kinase